MNTLLIIDPQNDFCDIPGAALPVPGASADLQRLAAFMQINSELLDRVIVTLDSQPTVAIERTSFWVTSEGESVAPFTEILARDVRAGRYVPRNTALTAEVLTYLDALESAGRYRLMVWPIHCVIGTWGHNIHADLAAQIAAWEMTRQRGAMKVLKGQNPLTEQYSAVRAEVPRADDPATQGDQRLIAAARPGDGFLLVAGEASSHCVSATVKDLLETMSPAERQRVALLRDCMSPVPGFESAADSFFADAHASGVRISSSTSAAQMLRERA